MVPRVLWHTKVLHDDQAGAGELGVEAFAGEPLGP
jgi:hypothetical protein